MPEGDGSLLVEGAESRTTLGRWLRRALIFAALLPLLWLLVINLLLWTGAVAALVSGERERSTIQLEHGWAWCVWPTEVHVERLHLAIDGARWQLDLKLPSGVAKIELHELLWRRFETTSIRGLGGASLSFSVKRPHGDDASSYEDYPRLRGMPPPVLDAEPRPVPAEEDAWEVVLGGVDTELSVVRVNAITAQMQGRLRGALDVRVGHRFAIPALELEIDRATIERGGEMIAERLQGSLSARVDAYSPEEVEGREALRRLSLTTSLGATLTGLGALQSLSPDLPVELSGGAGTVSCDLNVDAGTVAPGSSASYETSDVRIARTFEEDVSLALKTALHLRAEVVEGEAPTRVELTALNIESRVDDSKKAWMSAGELRGSATFSSADLVRGVGSMRSASASLPAFEVHDLAAVSGVASGLWIRGGRLSGNASAKSQEDAKTIGFDFAVDVDGLSIQKGKNSLRTEGYVRSDGEIVRGEEGMRTLRLEPLRAKLRQLQISTEKGESSPEWLRVDRAQIEHVAGSSRWTVEARGQLAELRSLLAHVRPGEDIFQRLPDRGLGTEPLDFDLSLTKRGGSLELQVSRLRGGPLDAVGAIASAGDETRLVVHLQRIGVGILSAGNGSRTVKLAVGSDWYDAKKRWVEGLRGGAGE